MFERFTDCARNVIALAHREAQRLNHNHLGTEHILLALTKESRSVGEHVLETLHIDIKALREKIEELSPAGVTPPELGAIPDDEREKHVIKYAIEEARQLKHSYIGSEHILLGLAKETDGIACKALTAMDVSYDQIKNEVMSTLAAAHQSESA